MKKTPTVLNASPARAMIAVVAIIQVSDGVLTTILRDVVLKKWLFDFIYPIALTAIVSVAIYLLTFKPMSAKQAELEWQHDELRCIQKVTVGGELRMKELAEELAALRNSLTVEKADNIQLTTGSLENPHHVPE